MSFIKVFTFNLCCMRSSFKPLNLVKLFLFILSISILIISKVYGEGTKQIRPLSTDKGYIELYTAYGNFATFSATADERLYIHISNIGEIIYFGFGATTNGSGTTVTTVK